ncbi:hypothetical protein AGMMS49991_01010 [Spirochaetia bacterium]|nr:hypothetical protein AGMMS49991_01010 [Spirochaetia bacterium]
MMKNKVFLGVLVGMALVMALAFTGCQGGDGPSALDWLGGPTSNGGFGDDANPEGPGIPGGGDNTGGGSSGGLTNEEQAFKEGVLAAYNEAKGMYGTLVDAIFGPVITSYFPGFPTDPNKWSNAQWKQAFNNAAFKDALESLSGSGS